jgi:hypothetical protein
VYPTEAEADLLSRMPDTILRGACRRSTPTESAPGATASIHCDLGGASDQASTATYDQFASSDQMQNFVVDMQDRNRLTKGSCSGQPAAWQLWQFGSFEGKLLCYRDPQNRANVLWTYDSSNILARGSRADADYRPLYDWWTETSALMVR